MIEFFRNPLILLLAATAALSALPGRTGSEGGFREEPLVSKQDEPLIDPTCLNSCEESFGLDHETNFNFIFTQTGPRDKVC